MLTFGSEDLVLTNKNKRLEYRNRGRNGDFGSVPHWGQRKLMLSEIQFLTNYWNPSTHPTPCVVYAGAGGGKHITFLSDLFPSFTFHLYDPSPFSICETEKIKIFTGKQGFFTNEIAAKYKTTSRNIFFISDIRTADYKQNRLNALSKYGISKDEIVPENIFTEACAKSSKITEDEVWTDMQLQQTWVQIMNPEHAFLKFRLPWPNEKKDQFVSYLDGTVFLQQFCPHTSTETRLKPIRNQETNLYESKQWNIREYEEQCFHHNVVVREQNKYKDIFTNKEHVCIDHPELLNDYDSVGEAWILRAYLQTKTNEEFSQKEVQKLSQRLTHHLNYDDMTGPNIITLNILRASPFKASGRNVSKRRNDWFREHPDEWKKCKRFLLS